MRLKHCSVNSKSKRLKQQVQIKDFSMKVLGWDDSCVCVQMLILLFWENQSERYVSWRCIRTVHMLNHLKLLCDAKNRPRGIIFFFNLFFNLKLFSLGSNFSVLEETKALSDSCRRDDAGPGTVEKSHMN